MSAESETIATSLVTVADGRAALGVTTQWLHKAYLRAAELPRGAAEALGQGLPFWKKPAFAVDGRTVSDWILSSPNPQAEAVALLDQANGYATQVYGELTARPDGELIGDLLRRKVAITLEQAEAAFRLVDEQVSSEQGFIADWLTAVRAVVVGVADGIGFAVKTATQAIFNSSPLFLGGAALAVLLGTWLLFRKVGI